VIFKYFQRKRWSAFEVGIWFSAAIITITLVSLVATNVAGSWALIVACAIVAAVGLMRYRAETEQKKRNASDRGE
jgi:membrane protein implicated in regulation of membrane protease activity